MTPHCVKIGGFYIEVLNFVKYFPLPRSEASAMLRDGLLTAWLYPAP